MTLKKVTREEALAELVDIKDELNHWAFYLKQLEEDKKKLMDYGAPKKIIDSYDNGITEAISVVSELNEVHDAQVNYCRKRGWV